MGAKPDLEIIALLAREMRHNWGSITPEAAFAEIRSTVRGYNVPFVVIETGGAAAATPSMDGTNFQSQPELIRPANNTLYTSGTLGRFSKMLNSLMEAPGELYHDPRKKPVVKEGSVQLETTRTEK